MTFVIDVQTTALETAAALLRTFADRAPSSERRSLYTIAESFEQAVAEERERDLEA